MMEFSDYHITLFQWGAVIGASLIAAVCDARTKRIPNWLTLPLLATGLVWRLSFGGITELLSSLGGCLLLALPFVILFVFAGGGAGDAKLMGAIGAWVGVVDGVVTLLAVVVAGAVLALAYAANKKKLRRVIGRLELVVVYVMGSVSLREAWTKSRSRVSDKKDMLAMPYGASIFTGVCVAALFVLLRNGS
jgi:Flp pilus assembly protein protease CpaA